MMASPPPADSPPAPRSVAAQSISPILDQICGGGSETTLNLRESSRKATGGKMFRLASMNDIVIFKYPNFDDRLLDAGARKAQEKKAQGQQFRKPIETGIFIPHDGNNLRRGGYAIYLRQKNWNELLKRHLGLEVEATGDNYAIDVKTLNAIDRIPSLDPFLLKSALAFRNGDIDPAYFTIREDEEAAVREVIAEKLRPVVARAFALSDAGEIETRTARFIDSLWDPSQREGVELLKSLGMAETDTSGVIEGWKGIGFYKVAIGRTREGVRGLSTWLKSKHSLPEKGRLSQSDIEQAAMLRDAVLSKLRIVIANVDDVFKKYDSSHATLLAEGNPAPFRRFLENVNAHYWTLGYCSMALRHSVSIFQRYLSGNPGVRLPFRELCEMLTLLNGTLAHQSDGRV
jgi:hypothetical protein